MKVQNKNLPLFPLFIGVQKSLYLNCSPGTQKNFGKLGKALFFTVLICGTILAASFCEFWLGRNYHYLPLVFIGSALFYYILDQSIIMGDNHRGKGGYRLLRVFIALVLGLFNSFLIDYYFFKEDIIAARHKEIVQEQQLIQERYGFDVKEKEDRKTLLLSEIDKMQFNLSAQLDSLNAEANGFGGSHKRGVADVWEAKHNSYLADSIRFNALQQVKQEEIEGLKKEITELKVQSEEESALVAPSVSTGINKSLQLLHQIIWLEGNFTNIFMSILILIVSMLLELIPLVAKDFFDVEEYFHLAASEKENNTTLANLKRQNNLTKESAILMNENALELIAQKSNGRIAKMQQEIAFAKAVMKETEQNMDELEKTDQNWQRKFPHLYPSYGLPVMQNAYATFASSTKQVFE